MLAVIGIGAGRYERFDFRFSAGNFTEDEILDSAVCPPGRYMIELARRVLAAMPSAEIMLIGNPLLPLKANQLEGWSKNLRDCPAILTDTKGFPLAYCLPRHLFTERERFLLPLSGVSAVLDARLLSLLSERETACIDIGFADVGPLPIPYAGDGCSQWITDAHRRHLALRQQCANAIALIEADDQWSRRPVASFHPNHAGDVLFWSLASRNIARPLYRAHVVCSDFLEIARAAATRLDLIELAQPPLSRVEGVGNETSYFAQALEKLGEDTLRRHFIVFNRFLRNYSHSPFHLIDQARFALGDSMRSRSDTVQHTPLAPESRCPLAPAPLRVLLHLSGTGWTLKAYPTPYRAQLCKALTDLGCQVTVIDEPDLESFGARSIHCGSVETLRQAAGSHHIFVGVDSFPHHFVRHVLGWPTIGLFGNTKTGNSDAAGGASYRTAMNYLPCNPCGHQDTCPAFSGPHCHNYVEPAPLVGAILDMAKSVYGTTR